MQKNLGHFGGMEQEELSAAIAAARIESGLSRAELARRAGIGVDVLVGLECRGTFPSVANAHAILDALGLYLRIGSQTSRKRLEIDLG